MITTKEFQIKWHWKDTKGVLDHDLFFCFFFLFVVLEISQDSPPRSHTIANHCDNHMEIKGKMEFVFGVLNILFLSLVDKKLTKL